MRYKKILDVSDDANRVYFTFFVDNNNSKIIAMPKINCDEKNILVGTSFNSLKIADTEKTSLLLTELMKNALLTHPSTQLCNQETLKLLK